MRLLNVWQAIPRWRGGPRQEGVRRGRVASLLVLAALSLMALVVPAGPAAADAASAMWNCQNGRVPQQEAVVTVLGNGGGSFPGGANPPNVLQRGDVLRILPYWEDRVRVDLWGQNYGPNGNNVRTRTAGWPFPGLFEFSAVLRTNNNPGGWVGPPRQATEFAGCNQWNSSLPVRLLFAVNDPGPGDNGGFWRFRVMIYKA
ncbi:MAG: hypothetical protein ACRDQY_08890 [Pseudonocardiaceae bacterium]